MALIQRSVPQELVRFKHNPSLRPGTSLGTVVLACDTEEGLVS